MRKELTVKARNGKEVKHFTYGGLVRTGGEKCDYNCRSCRDYLC